MTFDLKILLHKKVLFLTHPSHSSVFTSLESLFWFQINAILRLQMGAPLLTLEVYFLNLEK